MLVPGSVNPLLLTSAAGAAGGGISRSLRFNSADSAYLSRTPASAGNRRTWTWAGWVKRSELDGSGSVLFSAYSGSINQDLYITFANASTSSGPTNALSLYSPSSGNNVAVVSNAIYRDTSAWYHIVCSVDTTQATAANRVKLYVNGTEVTYNVTTYPTQNQDLNVNNTQPHAIGSRPNGLSSFFNGYLADIYFIDGQALTPSSFTETDATTGQLIPKAYTGSYGTNGFRLTFSDNSGTTSTTLGKDSAGSNNWTPNNFSVASGSGNDSLVDVPTNGAQTDTGVGGEVRGNYCTLNAADNNGGTLSNGNLQKTTTGATNVSGTIGMPSGKWYWEITVDRTVGGGVLGIGAGSAMAGTALSSLSKIYGYAPDGNKYANTTASSYGASYTAGDIIGIKFDADTRQLEFLKNNSSQGVAFTVDSGFVYFPQLHLNNTDVTANWGARPFAYTAPSGFKALCSSNLPAPLVTKPNTVMDVVLYTGTGSALTPTSTLGFNPDLVWIKSRSAATDHALYDSVRGVEKRLESNNTDAEVTSDGGVTAFNTAGFSVGTLAQVNTSSATYAGWCWDAGSSTDTNNTAGTITPTGVRANATAGFSVVSYTVSSSSQTAGHGLGVAPSFVICKRRDSTSDWYFQSKIPNANGYLLLNSTAALTSASYNFTSTTFPVAYLGGTNEQWVAYCFAPVVGYSSFGSYTGNGSADGPFVYTGFRPRWIMYKVYSGDTGHWFIHDTARNPYNVSNYHLWANLSNAEPTSIFYPFDILSNGFKVRTSDANANGNGLGFVWAAFAESPFNYARAR